MQPHAWQPGRRPTAGRRQRGGDLGRGGLEEVRPFTLQVPLAHRPVLPARAPRAPLLRAAASAPFFAGAAG